MAASTLPSWELTNGQNCYVTPAFSRSPKQGNKNRIVYLTPAFSGVPNKGDKIRSGCRTPAFSGAPKWAELLHNPCILGVP